MDRREVGRTRMNHLGLPHPSLLQYLPDRLLRSVHLLVCNLRGRQWGSQKPRLLFVSRNSWNHLLAYHWRVLHELRSRGFHPSPKWRDASFRGLRVDPWHMDADLVAPISLEYPEHRPDSYTASLAYLRRRMRFGTWSDTDRMRVALAPEVVG